MLYFTLPLPNLLACITWLIAHSDALHSSAGLLGGPEAVRRVARVIDAASSQTTITRRLLTELDWLHALLTLEKVGDSDNIETVCFGMIDPESPAIAEICTLAEAVAEHIEALRDEAWRARATA